MWKKASVQNDNDRSGSLKTFLTPRFYRFIFHADLLSAIKTAHELTEQQ